MKNQILFTLLLFLSLSLTVSAQTEVSPWAVGISIGKTQHDGDRGSSMLFGSPTKAHFGLRFGRYLGSRLDLVAAGGIGSVGLDSMGTDEGFDADLIHGNLAFHFKIIPHSSFTPYLSAGVGYASFTAESANSGDDSGLTVPFGLGLRWNISDAVGLFYHGQYNLFFSDEYDGLVANDDDDRHLIHELGIKFMVGKQDRDDDGVADSKDACPDTPGLREFDGCPDSDLDGIIDSEDDCPQVAGVEEYRGCPDTDGDGIIDKDDACPEVKGDAMYAGCPDTDGDGIGDNVDECPEESGVSKYNGCPVPDTDGDGFDDDNDECINTAGNLRGCPDGDDDGVADKDDACPDVAGSVNAMGCPDMDNDGVPDKDDECPEEAGVPANNGCPEVPKLTREEAINQFMVTILFKSGVTPVDDYDKKIDTIVAFAKKYPKAYLNLDGYSDSEGAESTNMTISQRRARKVYDSLVSKGVAPERMSRKGHGEANPAADNSTAEGRALNRRVVVSGSTVKRDMDRGGKK